MAAERECKYSGSSIVENYYSYGPTSATNYRPFFSWIFFYYYSTLLEFPNLATTSVLEGKTLIYVSGSVYMEEGKKKEMSWRLVRLSVDQCGKSKSKSVCVYVYVCYIMGVICVLLRFRAIAASMSE